jgi:hypothetical protein
MIKKEKHESGKSFLFSGIVLLGYALGIVHKLLYSFDWVIFAYILDFVLVAADIIVFLYVRNRYEKAAA